jgi:cobyrinic acid a,c-diamide synthase
MLEGIRKHQAQGKATLAECGGMLYLLEELGFNGQFAEMAKLLPGKAELTGGLRGLGLMSAQLPEGTLRGHSFHHSALKIDSEPVAKAVRQDARRQESENIYRLGRLTASYMHFYFGSNPEATVKLFSST